MPYKIAIATTDGQNIDRRFREAEQFYIIAVEDDKSYKVLEIRSFSEESKASAADGQEGKPADADIACGSQSTCGSGHGCGSGAGCGDVSPKLLLVEDCRCLICTQIGFKIKKQLERKAISAFEIECSIDEALNKIINYYDKVDHHQSLRGIARK